MEFKVPADLKTNRNGHIMNTTEDNSLIHNIDPDRNPWEPFSTGDKMRRSQDQERFFDNNGGESKADGAGTINKNGEYGPVTYGF